MYVIRLPNGNLLVPESATERRGAVISEAYVEIEAADPEYDKLAAQALTQEELDRRRQDWHDGDAELRRQFLDFLANRGTPAAGDDTAG
jgi:hypothetical protein